RAPAEAKAVPVRAGSAEEVARRRGPRLPAGDAGHAHAAGELRKGVSDVHSLGALRQLVCVRREYADDPAAGVKAKISRIDAKAQSALASMREIVSAGEAGRSGRPRCTV